MKVSDLQPRIFGEFSRILEKGRLSHAYLFSGNFGNFEFAIWLSQAIFCEQPIHALPCGECRSCRLVKNNEFSDLYLVEPEGQTIKTAQIRDLSSAFYESGYESSKKVIIINQAEKMHQNAANALLKSIEEPESEVYVFLLTENENLILPTIKSRTQVIQFPKNVHYFQTVLEKEGILKSQAEYLSGLSSSVTEAIALSQNTWFTEGENKLHRFVNLIKTSTDEAFLYVSTLLEGFDDKQKQEVAFGLLLQMLHQEKQVAVIDKVFQAKRMWQSNVRFELCLFYILLDKTGGVK